MYVLSVAVAVSIESSDPKQESDIGERDLGRFSSDVGLSVGDKSW